MTAGLTPKGTKMPQTIEEFHYLAKLDEKVILQQKKEIGQLKHKINILHQKLGGIYL